MSDNKEVRTTVRFDLALFEQLDGHVTEAKKEARRTGSRIPSRDSMVQEAVVRFLQQAENKTTSVAHEGPWTLNGIELTDSEMDLCRAILEINQLSPEKSEHIHTIARHLKGLIEVEAALAEYEDQDEQEQTA